MAYLPFATKVDGVTTIFATDVNNLQTGLANLSYNAKGYGATGDGITDDTTAIQAALTAASAAGGGVVYLPPGEYLISTSLTISSWVKLLGPGIAHITTEITGGAGVTPSRGAVLVIGGTKTFHMLTNLDAVNGNTGIAVEGIHFDQLGATGDVDIIRFSKVWRSCIRDNFFRGATGTTNKRGVLVQSGSEEVLVCANRFYSCGLASTDSNAMKVVYNEIGLPLKGITILTSFGSLLQCNHIYNATGDTINVQAFYDGEIIGNTIEDGDRHGISASNNLQHSVVLGNVIKSNSRSAGNAYSGIIIDSDTAASPSQYNTIAANICVDTQGAPTQKYGIYLDSFSGTQTNNNIITGNVFNGNATAGFGAKAGLTNIVRSNVGYVTEASGTGAIASGATGATITHGLGVTPAAANISVTPTNSPTNDPGNMWVSTITSTQFNVNCRNDPGASTLTFSWQALT